MKIIYKGQTIEVKNWQVELHPLNHGEHPGTPRTDFHTPAGIMPSFKKEEVSFESEIKMDISETFTRPDCAATYVITKKGQGRYHATLQQ